jgi:hypothetical protein
MVWYRQRRFQSAGLVILALLATQILQIILFLIVSAGFRKISSFQSLSTNLISLLPVVFAIMAGGAFLGRLRPDNALFLYSFSAVANGFIPVGIQMVLYTGSIGDLTGPLLWATIAGNIVLWFAGCFLGALSNRKKPDPALDRSLVQWTGGISGAVLLLYGLTWGSMVFSEGYRLAKTVRLPLPDGVEEIEHAGFEPGIARARRFKTDVTAGDTGIQEFYINRMSEDGWTDITDMFQSWPVTEWRFHTETIGTETVEYAVSGGHWQDISGKVTVTLVLQSQKTDDTQHWDDTDWIVHGIILSRPFTEPQNNLATRSAEPANENQDSAPVETDMDPERSQRSVE